MANDPYIEAPVRALDRGAHMRPRSRRERPRYGPMHEIWTDARPISLLVHAPILFADARPHPLYRYTPSLSLPVHTQHTTDHPRNVPSPNFACNSKTQVTQHPELTQTGMMLAVNCMRNCWTATSYAECHRNGCIHAACSPGCRPLGSHSRLATIPSTTPRSLHRYKTLPTRSPGRPNRYKTLPAHTKTPISAHFPHAGRIFSRSRQ